MEIKEITEQREAMAAEALAAGRESDYGGMNRKDRRAAMALAKKRVMVSHAGTVTNF